MNQEVISTFYNRAKIVANLDNIIASAKKSKNKGGQLSLFDTVDVEVETKLNEPENFNPLEWAEKEYDVLGFSLTWSKMDEFAKVKARYCNSSIARMLNGEGETHTMLVEIRNIEHLISKAGNPYAKVTVFDGTEEDRAYLFGKQYKNVSQTLFKGHVYLTTLATRETSTMIVDIMPARNIDVKYSSIWIKCELVSLPTARKYIYMCMEKGDASINVVTNGQVYPNIRTGAISDKTINELESLNIKVLLR